MAGVYTELITEIKARIEANVSGSVVCTGYPDERLTQDEAHKLFVYVTSIEEAYGRARQENCKDATLNATVTGFVGYSPDSTDVITATLLPKIEEVVDALNTTKTGVLNPQLVNASESMGISIGNFQVSSDRVWFDVNITVRTVPFTINNRQNT